MKRKRIKYLMRSRTLWIGCCIAAHMAIILWAIFAISKSMECILFSHTHSKHSIADPDMCQRQTYFRISCVLAFFYDIDPDFFSVLLFDMGQIFSSGKRHRSDKRKKWFLHGKGTAGTGGSRRNAISS